MEKDREDVCVELGGFGESLGARIGIEAGIADGEGQGAGGKAGFAKTLAGLLGKVAQEGFHPGDIRRVFAEGMVVGDGFGFGVNQEFVGVPSASFAIESDAPLAEDFLEFFLRMGGELLDGFDAECAESAFGDFTDTGNFADGERGEEARFHAGSDPDQAAGLALLRSDFRSEASGGETARAGEASLPGDGAEQIIGGGKWRTVKAFRAGEVEIGFINRDHFDDGRKFGKDGGDAIAPFGIFFMVPVEEDGVRAEASGGAKGHRGVDPIFAGFIAGGGDDAALIGTPTDDYRLAA